MKIGGYSHFNGITFFCDVFKIKGSKKNNDIIYDIEWIVPPKWLRKLENKFILGGILVAYYQWKVLDKKMKSLFLFLIGFYLMDEIMDLTFIDKYLDYYGSKFGIYFIIIALIIVALNYKRILRVFRYHGAEHKAINCFVEHGYVDLYLMKKASRFNKRCGSNIASIFLLLYIPIWVLNVDSLTAIVIVFLIALQITKILAVKNFRWDKYIQILQWITALEPREEEIEVAIGTFNQLQRGYYIYQSEATKGIKKI